MSAPRFARFLPVLLAFSFSISRPRVFFRPAVWKAHALWPDRRSPPLPRSRCRTPAHPHWDNQPQRFCVSISGERDNFDLRGRRLRQSLLRPPLLLRRGGCGRRCCRCRRRRRTAGPASNLNRGINRKGIFSSRRTRRRSFFKLIIIRACGLRGWRLDLRSGLGRRTSRRGRGSRFLRWRIFFELIVRAYRCGGRGFILNRGINRHGFFSSRRARRRSFFNRNIIRTCGLRGWRLDLRWGLG